MADLPVDVQGFQRVSQERKKRETLGTRTSEGFLLIGIAAKMSYCFPIGEGEI